jgi:hypothetical protein
MQLKRAGSPSSQMSFDEFFTGLCGSTRSTVRRSRLASRDRATLEPRALREDRTIAEIGAGGLLSARPHARAARPATAFMAPIAPQGALDGKNGNWLQQVTKVGRLLVRLAPEDPRPSRAGHERAERRAPAPRRIALAVGSDPIAQNHSPARPHGEANQSLRTEKYPRCLSNSPRLRRHRTSY